MASSVQVLESGDYVVIKITGLDAAAVKDVLAGPCRLHSIYYTSGSAAANYLKLYDDANPTIGTTDPDFVAELAASTTDSQPCNPPDGWLFSKGLSLACVTAAGTGGTTNPTGTVSVALHCVREAA